LLAALEFVQVSLYAGKESGDFGLDFGQQRGLRGCEVVFGDQFEVLPRVHERMESSAIIVLFSAYPRRLQHLAQSRIVAHTRIQDVDAGIEQLHARAE
jgi:hypothetical protein